MSIIPKGQEPVSVKRKIDNLLCKLDEAYPDKVIVSLAKDHKKWDETARDISRVLGYESKNDFLIAYGYEIKIKQSETTGRPSVDPTAVIDELKKRYPEGAPFEKMLDLLEANPDLRGNIKTLTNKSKELFGMAIADYFKSIGLLGGFDHKKQLDNLIAELKRRYPEGSELPETVVDLRSQNGDLPLNLLNYTKKIYGKSAKDYLCDASLLQNKDPVVLLEGFVYELKKRYQDKPFPCTLDQYEKENPDLAWYSAKTWVKAEYQISIFEYFKNNKMIGPVTTDLSQYLILSNDKKVVIGFTPPSNSKGELAVRIPAGVEEIQDDVFRYNRINHLYIPKELKRIGKYTLQKESKQSNTLNCIVVDKDNLFYRSDGTAFYKTENNKETLMYVFNHDIVSYSFHEGVSFVEQNAFIHCENLREIILSDCLETFDERVLPYRTKISKIRIPAGVKHLRVNPAGVSSWWDDTADRIHYTIDENNEHLFIDEDSIYEVLEDGSLKLVSNMYLGKGRALIRDDTSEIGEQAFFAHKNLLEVELPTSVRYIRKKAFSHCEKLKKAMIPSSIQTVATDAFSNCNNLDSTVDILINRQPHKLYSNTNKTTAVPFEYHESLNKKSCIESMADTTKSNKENINDLRETISKQLEEKDAFAIFADKFVSKINKLSVSDTVYKDYVAVYDSQLRKIKLVLPINQYTQSEAVLTQYIESAESIHSGDTLKVKIGSAKWEIFTERDLPLGYVDTFNWNLFNYLQVVAVNNCFAETVIPKSARRKNAKYAYVTITLDITERKPVESN